MNLLIVEDVESMKRYLEELLLASGHFGAIRSALNTWEARLEMGRHRPDLVLLDEVLPGESGLDLLRELKTQGFRVVLMTGIANPTHACPPEALGRLVKPSRHQGDGDGRKFVSELQELIKNPKLDDFTGNC